MFSDFFFIFVLLLANGFFAAAEMAIVSAREARLQALADAGDTRAKRALNLQRKPGEFLATVQVGITLVGTLASAVGGAELARQLAPLLSRISWLAPYADQIALISIVLLISYASLLIGELVPKRLAIRSPERWAMSVARIFEFLARVAAWPVRFLMVSANVILRMWGDSSEDDEQTSLEEIEIMVSRGTAQGVILPLQEQMIARVFDYADLMTRDVMTPRTEIVALEASTPTKVALEVAKESGYSRFPVYLGNIDHILGYVHIKDLIWAAPDLNLEKLARQVIFIPEGASLPQAFQMLTRAGRHLGIVLDEFSGTDGIITLENLLEVIVGEIEDEHSPVADVPKRDKKGEWQISGGTSISDVTELLGIDFSPRGVYTTLAGFIMSELGVIPQVGDSVTQDGYCFVVESMERFRIQVVRVYRYDSET